MLFPCCRHDVEAPMYLLVSKALLLSAICFAGQRDIARHLMLKVVAFMTGINILQRMVNTSRCFDKEGISVDYNN